jgi:uncharacterized protein
MASTYRTGKICYIELPAKDVARSADFYRGAFGWDIRGRGDGSVAFDDTVGQVSGSFVEDRSPADGKGLLVHIMVADIAAAADAIVAAGGEIVRAADPDAPVVFAHFRDPAGNVLGIYQEPSLVGTGVKESEVAITGLDLSGYMVKDAPRAIAFYRDVLGLEPVLTYPEDRGAEYVLPDGSTFGLWGGGGRVMPFQPSNGILFAVDDLDAAVSAVKARGIPVLMERETPVCSMAMINDTEGNIVTLHERKSS